jgi:hypothetical protein
VHARGAGPGALGLVDEAEAVEVPDAFVALQEVDGAGDVVLAQIQVLDDEQRVVIGGRANMKVGDAYATRESSEQVSALGPRCLSSLVLSEQRAGAIAGRCRGGVMASQLPERCSRALAPAVSPKSSAASVRSGSVKPSVNDA